MYVCTYTVNGTPAVVQNHTVSSPTADSCSCSLQAEEDTFVACLSSSHSLFHFKSMFFIHGFEITWDSQDINLQMTNEVDILYYQPGNRSWTQFYYKPIQVRCVLFDWSA